MSQHQKDTLIEFDDSIFELNSNLFVTRQEVGNHKNLVLTIDNVLKYPEKVREFMLSIPQQFIPNPSSLPCQWNSKGGFYPGYQTYLSYQIFSIEEYIKNLVAKEFGYSGRYVSYSFQRIYGDRKVYKQSNWPHCDDGAVAANFCLNYDHELDGETGTAFYRLKETGEEGFFPSACSYRKARYGFTPPRYDMDVYQPIVENSKYIRYHLAEFKFNRLNLYEGANFHTAFMEKGKYIETPRMTISLLY